jgi:hypothetical protein
MLELWEAPVPTPRDCSSAAKSACSVSSALCKLGAVAVPPPDEVVLETALLEGALLVELAVKTGVVVTGVVVTGLVELGEGLADEVVAALEPVDPVAEAFVPPLAEDSGGDKAWASWLSPEEIGFAPHPSPPGPTGLPVEVDCAPAACCRATDSASNSAETNCVSA